MTRLEAKIIAALANSCTANMRSGWATTYDVSYVLHQRYPFEALPSVMDLGLKIFRAMEGCGYVERRYTKDNPRPTSHTTQQFRPTDLGKRTAAEVFKGGAS